MPHRKNGVFVVALLSLVGVASTNSAPAQDGSASAQAEAYLERHAPGPQHELLSQLVGHWGVEGRMRFAREDTWEEIRADAQVRIVLGGMFLEMSLTGEQNDVWPMPYQALRYVGYDTMHGRYQLVVLHNFGTEMSIAEGADDAGRDVISVLGEMESLDAGDGEARRTRAWRTEVVRISPDHFSYREFLEDDQGDFLGIDTAFRREGGQPIPLLGRWAAINPDRERQTFEFRADGSATWSVWTPEIEESFEVRYQIAEFAQNRIKIDIFDIRRGILAGRTLYGIIEIADGGDSFRFDLEPGPVGVAASDRRPAEFTEDTRIFERAAD